MILVLGGFINQFFYYANKGNSETFVKETSSLWYVNLLLTSNILYPINKL